MQQNRQVPRTAIIIAGGEGTRLRPLTLKTPKPLVPILGKPLLEYIIDEIAEQGVKEAVLAIGYKAEVIESHFNKKIREVPLMLKYSVEKEKLGTGGAIKLAMSKVTGGNDIIVINGDNLFRLDFSEMYKRHLANKAVVTIAMIEVDDVTGSGVLALKGEQVTAFVEKPALEKAPSHFINCGIYIVSRGIAREFPDSNAFSFEREVLGKLAPKGLVYAYPIHAFYTVNDHEQYRKAEEALKAHKV